MPMNRYITVATFQFPQDAYVLKSKLESEGIHCFLKDELTVQTDNFLSNAIGGVKLQILSMDFEKAKTILTDEGYLRPSSDKPSVAQHKLDQLTARIPLLGTLPFTLRWITVITIVFTVIFVLYYLVTIR